MWPRRTRLVDWLSALIGLAATFLALEFAIIFAYNVYQLFEWSGYRRTGLLLAARFPMILDFTKVTAVVASLGIAGRLVGRCGSRDAGPTSIAAVARRSNNLAIGASLLVLALIWTMFLARL